VNYASFVKVVQLAQEAGATIEISFQNLAAARLNPGPAMAKFADVLGELVRTNGLKNVSWAEVGNEPNAPSGTVTFDQYNGLYRALNAQLIGRGLRGQIHLMGGGLVESGGARHHYARMQYIAQNMGDVLGIRGYNTCGTRPACRRRTSCITATQTARTSGGRTSPASSSSGSTSTLHNWASPGRRSGMRTGRCTTGAAW
jgi:hypothetical protein